MHLHPTVFESKILYSNGLILTVYLINLFTLQVNFSLFSVYGPYFSVMYADVLIIFETLNQRWRSFLPL